MARGDESPQVTPSADEVAGSDVRHYFSIGLARFTSELAIATLSDQQDLLLMFARSAPERSRVTYRLKTILEPATGNISPHFFVDFFGPLGEENQEYFTSLERIARSVLRRGWSTYTASHEAPTGYRVEITPKPGVYPKMRGDLGFLVDVLRATDGNCTLEISGIRTEIAAIESQGVPPESDVLHQPGADPGLISLYVSPKQGKGNTESAGDRDAIGWFMAENTGFTKLGIQVILTTPKRNDALSSWLGTALFVGETGERRSSMGQNQMLHTPLPIPSRWRTASCIHRTD